MQFVGVCSMFPYWRCYGLSVETQKKSVLISYSEEHEHVILQNPLLFQ